MGNVCSEESQELKVDESSTAKSPVEIQEALYFDYFMELMEKGIAGTLYQRRKPSASPASSPRRERVGVEQVEMRMWHRAGSFYYVDASLVQPKVEFSKRDVPSVRVADIALVQRGGSSTVFTEAATQLNWNAKRVNDLSKTAFSLMVISRGDNAKMTTVDVEFSNPTMAGALRQGFSMLARNNFEKMKLKDQFMKDHNPMSRPELSPPEQILKEAMPEVRNRNLFGTSTRNNKTQPVGVLDPKPEFATWHGLDVPFTNVAPRNIIVEDDLMSTLVVPPLVRRINDHDKELSTQARQEAKEKVSQEKQSWDASARRSSIMREATLRDLSINSQQRMAAKGREEAKGGSKQPGAVRPAGASSARPESLKKSKSKLFGMSLRTKKTKGTVETIKETKDAPLPTPSEGDVMAALMAQSR